jgi:L-amino acid N-acyltransferase YncA
MSNEFTVRDAVASDAGGICAIYNQAIAERGSTFETAPRSAADFHARVEDAGFPFLVGVAEERVLGWAGLASYSSRKCYAGIAEASVYVDARARGRGIGTALTEALAAAAEDPRFSQADWQALHDNLASIRLVERCGFDSVGLHRRHGRLDGDWRDVLVVERLLTQSRA